MILDITKLSKGQVSNSLVYDYPLNFKKEDRFATILIQGFGDNRQIQVFLTSESMLKNPNTNVVGEIFQTNDIKIAWEKFENLFSESDEGQKQNPDKPEPKNIFLTFNQNGEAKLFAQNLKKEQQLVYEYTLDDKDLIKNLPNSYTLDYTDNNQLPEQLRTKWLLANTNGEVVFEGTDNSYSTYQVAILSVAPPTTPPEPNDEEGTEPNDEEGTEPTDEEGTEPTDEEGTEPSDEEGTEPSDEEGTEPSDEEGTEPSDEEGEPTDEDGQDPSDEDGQDPSDEERDPSDEDQERTDEVDPERETRDIEKSLEDQTEATYDDIVQQIVSVSGFSNNKVQASLRDEENFLNFIEINTVNWQEISRNTGLSNNLYEFVSQVINISENN
jgi:hypothetical protein